ncbi:unnamed protein product [Agarophyton chilense]
MATWYSGYVLCISILRRGAGGSYIITIGSVGLPRRSQDLPSSRRHLRTHLGAISEPSRSHLWTPGTTRAGGARRDSVTRRVATERAISMFCLTPSHVFVGLFAKRLVTASSAEHA